jgi:hypothetical protein
MADNATPNLPSRDFEVTSRFYAGLGFVEGWRDAGWMILKRGDLTLEFFHTLNSIRRPVRSAPVCGLTTSMLSTLSA